MHSKIANNCDFLQNKQFQIDTPAILFLPVSALTCNRRKVFLSCIPMSRQCQCLPFQDFVSSAYSTMSRVFVYNHDELLMVMMTV